jgi:Peptidase family C25
MTVQKRNASSSRGRRHAAGALALVVWAAAAASAQSRELNASSRAQRLDVQRSLAAQPAVKISVRHAGWYHATQPQLVAAGLPPNANPHNLRLFADGVEQPLRVLAKAEGRFDASDAIEFYGTGVDTPFTDAQVYWLVAGSPGIRVPVDDGRTSATGSARSFPFTSERRDRILWYAALKNRGANKFFGDAVWPEADETLVVTDLDATSSATATVEVALQGVIDDPDVNPDHHVSVIVNGLEVGTMDFDGQSESIRTFNVAQSKLVEGANSVSLVAHGGDMDFTVVDYIRLTYSHTYTAEADRLRFSASGGQPVTVAGFSRGDIRLVDITDPALPRELLGTVRTQNGAFKVSAVPQGAGMRTLLAFTAATFDVSDTVRRNVPSTWSAANNAADYVVVTHGDFMNSVQPLKPLREAQGHHVAIIDVEDLYDEFSFGEKTPQAIKDFMIQAHAVWHTAPKFLLLVGDATMDPRNYMGMGQVDYVPVQVVDTAFLEVPSDDWFADTDGDGRPDLAAVGRLPAASVAQANAMVAKIRAYEATAEGTWSKSVLLVSDANDDTDDFEGATKGVEALVSPNYDVHKILRGSVGTDAARADLLARMNQGQVILNYFGHGSVDMWHEDVLTSADAPSLTNAGRLPFVASMTCLNGFFHTVWQESMAEALLRAPNGGAIAVWASSSLTDPGGQSAMDRELFRLLFTGAYPTLGEAVAAAKKAAGDGDVRRSWILFGDPATHLKGLPTTPVTSRTTDARPGKPGVESRESRVESQELRVESQESRVVSQKATTTDSRLPTTDSEWQMLSADLNADGLADLILYHSDTGAWMEAMSRADGSADFLRGQWPAHAIVRALDLNGDGRTDVFAYQPDSGAWLTGLSNGLGGFTYHTGTWAPGWNVEFGDFNGDRLVDVLLYNAAAGTGTIGLNDGAGGFNAIHGPWAKDWTVRVGNFNGDSFADLLLYDAKTGEWMEGLGDGTGRFTYYGGKWAPGYDVHVADFDGDHRDDVFLYSAKDGSWALALTTAPGHFAVSGGMWTPGWVVTTGDLNGDHRADVFLYNPESGQTVRCLMTKAGRFDCAPGKWPRGAAIDGLVK